MAAVSVALTGLLAGLAVVLAPAAAGSAPAPPPGCSGNSFSFTNDTPAAVSGGVSAPPVTRTIQVSGAQRYLRDVDVITDISHSFSADLDITVRSPQGTVVTLTTDNGEGNDNVFGNGTLGTRWDDDAGEPVTDAVIVNNVPTPSVVPEEAMAAFIGEDPNGTWTLTVADDSAPDNGQLHRWSLELATLNGTPVMQTTEVTGTGPQPIPNPGPLMSPAVVAGADAYVADVELRTDISHEASGDLDVSLRSPSGTISKMSTGNGASFDDVFGGLGGAPTTRWYDKAGASTLDDGGGPVTDASFVNDVVETDLVPEEAMGAFVGENPNGTWSLDVVDRSSGGFGGDSGTLNAWSLSVRTISGCSPPPNDPPIASAGGPYAIAEGGSLALDASGSSDPEDAPLTYSWDVNGDGTFGDASGEKPTLSWDELKALGIDDGPATFEVRVLVSDGSSSTTSSPATLTLSNAAPSLEITGPDSATAGQNATWTFAATDPSPDDQAGSFTYRIDWDGDGSVDEIVTGDNSTPVSHIYSAPGDFTIKATATDKNAGESAEETKAVSVAAAPAGSPGETGPGAGAAPPGGGPGSGRAPGGTAPGSLLDPAPLVSQLSLSAPRFGVSWPRTVVSGQRRRRLRRGTTIRYSLSEPATAYLRIERALPGRRVGRRCRAPSRRLRSRRRCTRYRRAGTLVRSARTGRNATPFSGRIRRRALRPGRYRLVVTAIDGARNRSRPRVAFFRILRG